MYSPPNLGAEIPASCGVAADSPEESWHHAQLCIVDRRSAPPPLPSCKFLFNRSCELGSISPMSQIATFSTDDSISTVRSGWLYPLGRLLKSPHTAAMVPEFQALGSVFKAAITTQSDLDDRSVFATAGRDAADDGLDPIMVQIINALRIVTKNNPDDPLIVSFLGTQTPTEIIRPLLGAELVTAAEWIGPLKEETDPILQTFVAPLEAAVATGQAAEKELKASEKALSDFRLLGERKKLVDAVNAARGSLFGALVKFQHENTALRLPDVLPQRFTRHHSTGSQHARSLRSRRVGAQPPPSPSGLWREGQRGVRRRSWKTTVGGCACSHR
jgi:hypothetical protein